MPYPEVPMKQIVDDILCAAFEGGSTYWSGEAVRITKTPNKAAAYASEVPSRGGALAVHESGDGEMDVWHALTYDKMVAGIKKAAQHYGLSVARFYDDHDAEYADVALQFALFNEIVYG